MFFFKKKKQQKNEIYQEETSVSPVEIKTGTKNPLGGILWYQKNYYLALKLASYLGLALILSLGLSFYLFLSQPKPVYYAVTPDMQLTKLVPLSQPLITEQGLLNWVTEVVTSSISLDFLHWREKLQSIRPNFSPEAFTSFTKSMSDAGILEMVQSKRLSLSSVVKQAPVITNSGLINNVMSWKVEFLLLLSYESSQGVELTQELLAEVLVSRASTPTTPKGIVIKQVVLRRK